MSIWRVILGALLAIAAVAATAWVGLSAVFPLSPASVRVALPHLGAALDLPVLSLPLMGFCVGAALVAVVRPVSLPMHAVASRPVFLALLGAFLLALLAAALGQARFIPAATVVLLAFAVHPAAVTLVRMLGDGASIEVESRTGGLGGGLGGWRISSAAGMLVLLMALLCTLGVVLVAANGGFDAPTATDQVAEGRGSERPRTAAPHAVGEAAAPGTSGR